MQTIKKLSEYQVGLIILSVLLMILNYKFSSLYSSKIITLRTYEYIFIPFNFIIIFTGFILKKRINQIYRTLVIIMIGVCNLLQSIMQIENLKILIYSILNFALILSFVLLLAFLGQSCKD